MSSNTTANRDIHAREIIGTKHVSNTYPNGTDPLASLSASIERILAATAGSQIEQIVLSLTDHLSTLSRELEDSRKAQEEMRAVLQETRSANEELKRKLGRARAQLHESEKARQDCVLYRRKYAFLIGMSIGVSVISLLLNVVLTIILIAIFQNAGISP